MAIKVLYAVPHVHEATLPVLERLRAADCELSFNRTGPAAASRRWSP
jgi:hypothetical protein